VRRLCAAGNAEHASGVIAGSEKRRSDPDYLRAGSLDCFASLAMTVNGVHTGSAMEYFTWLSAKLDSIEAIPSSRVSLLFKKAS
jgi:hypothetical protein